MHYSNLVIVAAPEEPITDPRELEAYITDAVAEVMGPPEEQGGFYDWYQIGGRWTGLLDGFDPDRDPRYQKPCDYCEQGITTDAVADRFPAYRNHVGKTCIQCKGTGHLQRWPTEWPFRPGDVQPVSTLTIDHLEKAYRVVTPQGTWEDRPPLTWILETFKDHLVVVVDNHS